MKRALLISSIMLALPFLNACDDSNNNSQPRNVIFFLGDGMGTTTLTASRIYKVGEDGQLTMDTLPETAWVRTYSNDAQVTDSAPSMSAYMTGVKMNNEVIAMSPDTIATKPGDANNTINLCAPNNGHPVPTLIEQAKQKGYAVGVVTTTRVTHATPAATYSHICHRDLENDIAAQVVPGNVRFNTALLDGLDVLMGGGRKQFQPASAGGSRTDGRDLTVEMQAVGYSYVKDKASFKALDLDKAGKVVGLFTGSHMTYELDRDATKEPSLAEMTGTAIDLLKRKERYKNGFMLMVEGGRIDHALHEANAARAFRDTVAFDDAIKVALDKMRAIDPDLKNTLIVVTADHDHTLLLNGYAQRTGKTTPENPGVLGLVKNVTAGSADLDADGAPYSVVSFGTGPNRVADTRSHVALLTDAVVSDKNYHQESAVRLASETHGGTDVPLMAIGRDAEKFHGFLTNTEVFPIIQATLGLH